MASELQSFVDTTYTFGDGVTIKIVQIKPRDTGYAVTYETCSPNAFPRRLVMSEAEFISNFAHLFVG